MRARRLLGQTEREIEVSALVQEGQMKRSGTAPPCRRRSGGRAPRRSLRHAARRDARRSHDGERSSQYAARALNPDKAAEKRDNVFRVTVVGTTAGASRPITRPRSR